MPSQRVFARFGLAGLSACLLGGCMGDPLPKPSPAFPQDRFPAWQAGDQGYRFFPGAKFRMDIRTAPELSADLTVGPDGRVSLPTIGPVMVAGQTSGQMKTALEDIY